MSEQTANLCTTDAAEAMRETIADQAQEIERLRLNIAEYNEHERCYQSELAALKAQPARVVLADDIRAACQTAVEVFAEETNSAQCREVAEYMREVLLARLNSSPVSAVCDTCHGEGEVWTGENQSFGYMSMQPPEPIMEACPECSGELVRPASAGDDRKLSDIGNELHNLSCHVVHHNEGWANQLGALASELWYWPASAGGVDERE